MTFPGANTLHSPPPPGRDSLARAHKMRLSGVGLRPPHVSGFTQVTPMCSPGRGVREAHKPPPGKPAVLTSSQLGTDKAWSSAKTGGGRGEIYAPRVPPSGHGRAGRGQSPPTAPTMAGQWEVASARAEHSRGGPVRGSPVHTPPHPQPRATPTWAIRGAT